MLYRFLSFFFTVILISSCQRNIHVNAPTDVSLASTLIEELKNSDLVWIIYTNPKGEEELQKTISRNPKNLRAKKWLQDLERDREKDFRDYAGKIEANYDFTSIVYVPDSIYQDFLNDTAYALDSEGEKYRISSLSYKGFSVVRYPPQGSTQESYVLRYNNKIVPSPIPSVVTYKSRKNIFRPIEFSERSIKHFNNKLHKLYKESQLNE